MREILFRGKRDKKYDKDQDWVYGVPYIDNEGDCIIADDCSKRVVVSETVGQYTGLTDKNGKKIFEGDIVKDRGNALHIVKIGAFYPAHYIRMCSRFGELTKVCDVYGVYAERITNDEYKGEAFVIPLKNGVEVIGNIHDNPELLKGCAE